MTNLDKARRMLRLVAQIDKRYRELDALSRALKLEDYERDDRHWQRDGFLKWYHRQATKMLTILESSELCKRELARRKAKKS